MEVLIVGDEGCTFNDIIKTIKNFEGSICLYEQWQEFGIQLDLTVSQLHEIANEKKNCAAIWKIEAILITWRNTRSYEAKFGVLLRALKDLKFNAVADKLRERFVVKTENYMKLVVSKNSSDWKHINRTVHVSEGTFGYRKSFLKRVNVDNHYDMELSKNEVDVLAMFDWHESIIRCYVAQHMYCEWFVVALEDYTTLKDLSLKMEDIYSMRCIHDLIHQLLNGAEFLHKNSLLHLDIKLENILIIRKLCFDYLKVKIGGFYWSRKQDKANLKLNDKVLSIQHDSPGCFFTPEVLEHTRERSYRDELDSLTVKLDFPTDIFCLGTVIYYLLSNGKDPYSNDAICRAYFIREKKIQLEKKYLDALPRHSQKEFRKVFSSEPDKRPNIFHLKSLFR